MNISLRVGSARQHRVDKEGREYNDNKICSTASPKKRYTNVVDGQQTRRRTNLDVANVSFYKFMCNDIMSVFVPSQD